MITVGAARELAYISQHAEKPLYDSMDMDGDNLRIGYGSTVKGDYYKQIVKDPKFVDKLRGIFRGSQDLLSPISDSLQKRGSFKGGMEELQSAMMLPMLLQQILGE